jgi:hypothetical protein
MQVRSGLLLTSYRTAKFTRRSALPMICVSAKVAKVAKPATSLLLATSMKASLRKQVEDHLRHA